MKLGVVAIGRLKAGPERTLAQDYISRIEGLSRKAGIAKFSSVEFGESQLASAAQRQAEEQRLLLSACGPKAFTVVLDERGKALDSVGFAQLLTQHQARATAELDFMIGGPDGHTAETRDKAGLLLSFGVMTWPHRLVRLMLLEQIYRAMTIMLNHPYHRA